MIDSEKAIENFMATHRELLPNTGETGPIMITVAEHEMLKGFLEYTFSFMQCKRCKYDLTKKKNGMWVVLRPKYLWCNCQGIDGCIRFEERE